MAVNILVISWVMTSTLMFWTRR